MDLAIRRAFHTGRIQGLDPGVELREPVGQLDRLTQVHPPRVRGETERGGELQHTELRHQRGTRPGDRQRLLSTRDQHRRLVQRVGRVHPRPRDRGGQLAGGRAGFGLPFGAHVGEQRGGVVAVVEFPSGHTKMVDAATDSPGCFFHSRVAPVVEQRRTKS